MVSASIIHKVFVVGSTGATGKHVVRMLLDRGDTEVVAVARSRDKLMGLLNLDETRVSNLTVKEASIGSLSADELKELTEGCSAAVSCLGHNLTMKGIYRDGYFVSETAKMVSQAMSETGRFILMGSDGVAHPDGITDPKRSLLERGILGLLRWMVPPVRDNEMAAKYLYKETTSNRPFCDWAVVRPGDLINKDDSEVYSTSAQAKKDYEIMDHPPGFLFGVNNVARSDVARFMVELATMETKAFQETYNHKMPCIYQIKTETEGTK